jgi:acyl-CoA dehydrogenase
MTPMSAAYDLRPSAEGERLCGEMVAFMNEEVFPAEAEYDAARSAVGPDDHAVPEVVERLKASAARRGLWNLFLPAVSGISHLDNATIAELSGWSVHLAPEATNSQAPDSGNIELLHLFADDAQRRRWLEPLLAGTIRSAFAMTERHVAGSDASRIETSIRRDGDDYVVDGHKWWTSGAADPRCALLIVMGRTDPGAAKHRQHSMVLVPRDTPGVTIVRDVPVFGRHDQHGHVEVAFDGVRVPAANLLGQEGHGFAQAQARLGPGRLHHCLRAIGAAERAMQLLVDRARTRKAFGGTLGELGTVQQAIAESRVAIEQARLLCRHAAATFDAGDRAAAIQYVSMAKAAVPRMTLEVIDRAIQVHGGMGVSDDVPLAAMYGWHRAMRIFDGPDEVHLRSIARYELRREEIQLIPEVRS